MTEDCFQGQLRIARPLHPTGEVMWHVPFEDVHQVTTVLETMSRKIFVAILDYQSQQISLFIK